MLQQTQVERVREKFISFLKKYPTISTLAHTSVHELLTEWKGLGYPRRALNVQKCARKVLDDYHGVVPQDCEELKKLPGIGPYTASAVMAFAFDKPVVVLDTNIRRIFIHFFCADKTSIHDNQLVSLIEKTIWKKSPRVWYSALMDYGSGAFEKILNPNTKSRHYVRQSKFEGSARYARAKLLAFILENGHQSELSIRTFMKKDPHLKAYQRKNIFIGILDALVKDGFLEIHNNMWRVVNK